MPPSETADGYVIWGADHAVYGPVELPTLVGWIRDERVVADTWLFVERTGHWEKAAQVQELQMFFHGANPTRGPADTLIMGNPGPLSPGALRHIRLLSGLNDEQLEELLRVAEVLTVTAGTQVAKQGEQAVSMLLLVEGEMRMRAVIDGHENSLGNLNAGEFFGEMSLFDHGIRSADLVANQDSTLLKFPAAEFEKFTREKPELAAPVLHMLAKTLAVRLRGESKRYRDSICYVRTPGR